MKELLLKNTVKTCCIIFSILIIVHAFEAINALERLSQDKNDALKMSSVVENALATIENASKIGTAKLGVPINTIRILLPPK